MGQSDWNHLNQHTGLQVDSKFKQDKEKRKTAVALSYDPNDEAPKIIASGRGMLADRIVERAQESQVPVHKDEKLANTLSKLDIGDYIPKELYQVVAEVLLFVDKMDNIKAKAMGAKHE